MLTALILSMFVSTAEAHQSHKHRAHHVRSNQHSSHCSHIVRGYVWIKDYGWVSRHKARWVPGHYAGRGHQRHWVPGRFVMKARI